MTSGRAGEITVIVPTYNEGLYVEDCVASVMDDAIGEVLVVDGGSTDGTRDAVTRLMARYPEVRLLDNPRRTAASAMNIGLAAAAGDIIVRLDAHSVYPEGYIRRLTSVLRDRGADVTGGVIVAAARRPTAFGRAVAASLVNRWVMGNTGFRVGGGDIRPVDTVPFGCWRTTTLRRAGGYNEELFRSQDYDLSQRLQAMGATILLVPDVVIEYKARSGVWENVRYNFWNGFWVGYPLAGWHVRFSARHLVPGVACLGGLLLVGTSWAVGSARPLLPALAYGVVLVMSAFEARRSGAAVVALMPFVTAGTHLLHGAGMLWGLLRGAAGRFRRPAVRRALASS